MPFPDGDSVQLMAARRSPVLMSDQIRVAWEELLRAECSARPVLLVLEDLHWGDLPSVLLVDSALRNLGDQRLMVLALGRPEVRELFPKLWAGRGVHEVQLSGLPRRASERLVRQVLGEDVAPELVAMIVDRADGNAFYLEEQLRAVADGKGADLPETVVAMVQARIEALDIEARRALRAASVFGQTFWPGGVRRSLGGAPRSRRLARAGAARGDLPARRGQPARRGGVPLPARDRAGGGVRDADGGRPAARAPARRRVAVARGAGAVDAMALGGALRARRRARAGRGRVPARGAAGAAERSDLAAAIARAERGVACGPNAQALGALRLVEAEAHVWRGELALAEQRGTDGRGTGCPPAPRRGSRRSRRSPSAAGKLGGFERVERWMGVAQAAEAAAEGAAQRRGAHVPPRGRARLLVPSRGGLRGRRTRSIAAVERAIRDGPRGAGGRGGGAGLHDGAVGPGAMSGGDPSACVTGLEAGARGVRAGRRPAATRASPRANAGVIPTGSSGISGAPRRRSARSCEATERMGLHEVAAAAQASLGQVLAYRGKLDEARAGRARRPSRRASGSGDPRAEVVSRGRTSRRSRCSRGDFEGAEQARARARC